ncbi:helix-turn-helix domain-containing protein [Lactococcus garvieae]|uniref:helix-turn-helix domain-containing protein n=1 Tax=Lactococcus garvieae TaxID=1363 RepID=UPI00254A497E|nr:S24 family peptidase [Lactococcus garvieae]
MSGHLGNKEIMAENLQRYMNKYGLDRNDIAEIAGVSYFTVRDWLVARTYPRIDKIERLANHWNISKADLVEPESERPKPPTPIVEEITKISSKLEEPRQKIVLDTAKIQLTEQEKVIAEAKKRERKILGLDSKPIDITKLPGYMPYEPDKMGTAPILGEIAAGYNIMAEENFDGMMPVSAEYAGRDDVFWLNIRGQSMESLIHDGSFGLFECSDDIYDGRIGAVMAEDGDWITVKRIYHNLDENGYLLGLTLVPENDECPTIEINEYNPGRIIGTLLEVKQYF